LANVTEEPQHGVALAGATVDGAGGGERHASPQRPTKRLPRPARRDTRFTLGLHKPGSSSGLGRNIAR
jgi:hypothetical protein